MTNSLDDILLHKNFITNLAVLTFGKSCFGTSGSYCIVDNLGVTKSLDNFLLYKDLFALSALASISKTRLRAVGSLTGNNYYFKVCAFSIANESASVTAFVVLIVISVRNHRNLALLYENFLTNVAVLTFGKTCSSTSSCYFRIDNLGVTRAIDNLCLSGEFLVTSGAINHTVVASVNGAGCLYAILLNRSCGRMSESGNDFLRYEYFVTNAAVLTFGKSCIGTSRSYRRVNYFGMSESGNGLLRYENSLARLAMRAFGETCSGTRGSYSRVNNSGVLVSFPIYSLDSSIRSRNVIAKRLVRRHNVVRNDVDSNINRSFVSFNYLEGKNRYSNFALVNGGIGIRESSPQISRLNSDSIIILGSNEHIASRNCRGGIICTYVCNLSGVILHIKNRRQKSFVLIRRNRHCKRFSLPHDGGRSLHRKGKIVLSGAYSSKR